MCAPSSAACERIELPAHRVEATHDPFQAFAGRSRQASSGAWAELEVPILQGRQGERLVIATSAPRRCERVCFKPYDADMALFNVYPNDCLRSRPGPMRPPRASQDRDGAGEVGTIVGPDEVRTQGLIKESTTPTPRRCVGECLSLDTLTKKKGGPGVSVSLRLVPTARTVSRSS